MKKKILSVFLLLALFISSAALAAQSSESNRYPDFPLVHDEAGTMSADERKSLEDKLQQISTDYDIRVAVLTLKNLPTDKDIRQYGKDYLFEHYRDLENSNGSIIFVQVTGDRSYRVVTDNNMREIITDDIGYPYLEEQFLPHLKDDEYYEAYEAYADGVDYLCNYYGEHEKPYDPDDEFSIPGFIIGLLLSAGVGLAFYCYLEDGMSNVRAKEGAEDYFDNSSFTLSQSEDIFLYTSTHVIHHERNNDSSSSSGNDSDSGGGGGRY